MPSVRLLKSIVTEYGVGWAINRVLYSAKLKLLCLVPATERLFEKKTAYSKRLDLFQIDVPALRSFLQGLDDTEKANLIALADDAANGIINGFSSTKLDYGTPFDWQLNPLTGKHCDAKQKWYRIPDFDSERGDIKIIWEASRFSHFITLCRAYLMTNDARYYRAFSEQLSDWLKTNPYGRGANFKCGQECSLRMVNALLAYTVFQTCGIATDADASNMRDLIDRCYRKVLGNFFYAYRCIKNNHTISELMGMIVGAWCCEDEKRLNRAFVLLDRVIDEQFSNDGGYKQLSFNYQRLALQDLECVMSIEKRIGKSLSVHSKEKIKNAALLMYQCQDASGDVPNYGNNDGALVFPVTSCGYRDFRPVINTAWTLCAGKQLYANGPHQEELLWFSAGNPLKAFKRQSIERVSKAFRDAGLFTLRGKRSWAMIVANRYRSRPAHMDQLHFDLWIDGINVLCDAGTYSYADALGKELIQSKNHNTASLDGIPQMRTTGQFMVWNWTGREQISHETHAFEGTVKSKNGYRHNRRISQDGDSYEITDRVDREYEILFHTPCEVAIDGNRAVLSCRGKAVCELIGSGTIEQRPAVRSLFYLKTEPAACLVLHGHANEDITTRIKRIEGEEK